VTISVLNLDPTIMSFDETRRQIFVKYGKPGVYSIEIILKDQWESENKYQLTIELV
jgi:hypothetical protein